MKTRSPKFREPKTLRGAKILPEVGLENGNYTVVIGEVLGNYEAKKK